MGTVSGSEVGPGVYCLHTTPSLTKVVAKVGDNGLVVVVTMHECEEAQNYGRGPHTTNKQWDLGVVGALHPV